MNCSRANCNLPRVKSAYGECYCEKHSRFIQMRSLAKKRGKSIPSHSELDSLVPKDMRCVVCKVQMTWGRINGDRSVQITLQHDRSGIHRLICMRCNMRHAIYPGDTFYSKTPDTHYCRSCERFLPLTNFWIRHTGRLQGRTTGQCKACRMARYFRNKHVQHDIEVHS